jgi:hypothetical protein
MNSAFKFLDGTTLDYISFVLTVDWMSANNEGRVMFIGTCDCPRAVTNTVPITAAVPVAQCAFCQKNVQLTPMAVYGRRTKEWYVLPYRAANPGTEIPF